MTKTMTRTLDCEICGASFKCGGPISLGCWCLQVTVTREKRAQLKLLATDCVCPNCLNEAE